MSQLPSHALMHNVQVDDKVKRELHGYGDPVVFDEKCLLCQREQGHIEGASDARKELAAHFQFIQKALDDKSLTHMQLRAVIQGHIEAVIAVQ